MGHGGRPGFGTPRASSRNSAPPTRPTPARFVLSRALPQLRLRVEASGGLTHGVLRPPAGAGSFRDLDEVQMLRFLESREALAAHASLFNQKMFAPDQRGGGTRQLDKDWKGANGLRGLRYEARERKERILSREVACVHVVAHLGA